MSYARAIRTIAAFSFVFHLNTAAQKPAGVDSSLFVRDSVRPIVKRFENLRITGYMQPQFQVAQSEGAPSFAGGNFSQFSKSRFMLRRARLKAEYLLTSREKYPQALFTFQIDATERGVIVRDMFVRLHETRKNLFSMSAGFFARPFGFEVNLSSSHRETPERGRMSQILMPGERDLGAMLSFEPQEKTHRLRHFRLDAGFFNGQGASGPTDFDSYKDFISRLTIKPFGLGRFELSGGLSLLRGGWRNGTKYVYSMGHDGNGNPVFVVDSSEANLGRSSPRHYHGGDVQLKWKHGWGETEWRAEYWFGTQPGTAAGTSNPGTLPSANGQPLPAYVRQFDGAFFYFLQTLGNVRNQVLVKYDWFDPNRKAEATDIGRSGTNLTSADIRFSTLGVGFARHWNDHVKLIFYYDMVRNESTLLSGFTGNLKDDIFTCRLQFRF
ncbi:MAG TPA: porin [Chitinophagaceae bacterium]|nr:porin [Chitinophagaceae bacterium]